MAVLAAAIATGNTSAILGAATFEVASTVATIYGGKYVYDKFAGSRSSAMPMPDLRKRAAAAFRSTSKRQRGSAAAARSGRVRRTTYKSNARQGGLIGRFQPSEGPELKFHDQGVNWNMSTTGQTYGVSMTIIPRGTAATERIGQKCTIKAMYYRGTMYWDPSTGPAPNIFYIWVVLDTECNGVAPAFNEVFDTTQPFDCQVNMANSKRFRILKKLELTFNATAADTDYATQAIPVSFYMKCGIPIKWTDTDTTGNIGNQTQNSIHFLGGRYAAGSGVPQAVFSGVMRLRFSD